MRDACLVSCFLIGRPVLWTFLAFRVRPSDQRSPAATASEAVGGQLHTPCRTSEVLDLGLGDVHLSKGPSELWTCLFTFATIRMNEYKDY